MATKSIDGKDRSSSDDDDDDDDDSTDYSCCSYESPPPSSDEDDEGATKEKIRDSGVRFAVAKDSRTNNPQNEPQPQPRAKAPVLLPPSLRARIRTAPIPHTKKRKTNLDLRLEFFERKKNARRKRLLPERGGSDGSTDGDEDSDEVLELRPRPLYRTGGVGVANSGDRREESCGAATAARKARNLALATPSIHGRGMRGRTNNQAPTKKRTARDREDDCIGIGARRSDIWHRVVVPSPSLSDSWKSDEDEDEDDQRKTLEKKLIRLEKRFEFLCNDLGNVTFEYSFQKALAEERERTLWILEKRISTLRREERCRHETKTKIEPTEQKETSTGNHREALTQGTKHSGREESCSNGWSFQHETPQTASQGQGQAGHGDAKLRYAPGCTCKGEGSTLRTHPPASSRTRIATKHYYCCCCYYYSTS